MERRLVGPRPTCRVTALRRVTGGNTRRRTRQGGHDRHPDIGGRLGTAGQRLARIAAQHTDVHQTARGVHGRREMNLAILDARPAAGRQRS